MEQIENKMLLDEYWANYGRDWDEYYEGLAEKADRDYEEREGY